MPKKDLYDKNGLYRGTQHLADRRIDQTALKILGNDQVPNVENSQINQAVYSQLTQSHVQSNPNLGLEESLVGAINSGNS